MAETGHIAPRGALTMASAASRLTLDDWPAASGTLTVDLAGIDAADSAGVSVLLHWLREAQQRQVKLHFVHLPPALQQLAKLYGVADWLHAP
ncbi:STAS domain-containing protein [Jeongeupia wiesaeckerbachi]|uniref:STAS domain-containing protein n=1 Tax=Jeongeupia wiesaeckerbachi TaxID=3051218 RepID=UPI003D805D42